MRTAPSAGACALTSPASGSPGWASIEIPSRGKDPSVSSTPSSSSPPSWGYSCYVFGFDHFRKAIRSFKVERLEEVEVLDSRFEMLPDFDPYDYLRHSWGIRGGDEVVEVKLRFSKKAVYRVNESDWPGVVAREEDQEGRCTLTFRVNHLLEIKSWIRAWGPEGPGGVAPKKSQRIP